MIADARRMCKQTPSQTDVGLHNQAAFSCRDRASRIGRGSNIALSDRIFPSAAWYHAQPKMVIPEMVRSWKRQISFASATLFLYCI
jgi:hypothetical protein